MSQISVRSIITSIKIYDNIEYTIFYLLKHVNGINEVHAEDLRHSTLAIVTNISPWPTPGDSYAVFANNKQYFILKEAAKFVI